MPLEKTSEAAFSVTTVQRIRANSNIPVGQDDDVLGLLLENVNDFIERYLECSIGTCEMRLTLDRFPRCGELLTIPVWPVQSITSITYNDTNETQQTLNVSRIAQPRGNGRYQLRLKKRSDQWPCTDESIDNVEINFVAGFATQKQIPSVMVRAALMLASHWYENREAVITGSISKEIELAFNSAMELLREDFE